MNEDDVDDYWMDDIRHYPGASLVLQAIFDDVVACVQDYECFDVDTILDYLRDDWGDVYTDDEIKRALISCEFIDFSEEMERLADYERAMAKDD